MSPSPGSLWITMCTSALCLLGGSSQSFAQASLFICDVPATKGGCVNGTHSPPGFVTFDFSGFYSSFVGGTPASSPVQAPYGSQTQFSLFWQTTSPGTNTPEQTIFFTGAGGLVSDVLDYQSFVTGGAGRDFMDILGYEISYQTPVTIAQLERQGVTPTGFAPEVGLYNFPTTDLAATFQPGPIPEIPTWGLLLLGFGGLGFAASRAGGARRACAGFAPAAPLFSPPRTQRNTKSLRPHSPI